MTGRVEQLQQENADLRRRIESLEATHQARGEFLATLSHELRTPLNAIIGFSEVMAKAMLGPLGTPAYQGYAQDIHASGEHLLSIINDLLDLAQIDAGRQPLELQPIHLHETVARVLRMLPGRPETQGLSLTIRVPEDLPPVMADDRAIRQILLNLLANALKFTPKGREVRILADLTPSGEHILIRVQDTGMGMASEDLARLTLPFEQARPTTRSPQDGLGLGLAIVRALVEGHGASLILESQPDQGTTISFHLAVSAAA